MSKRGNCTLYFVFTIWTLSHSHTLTHTHTPQIPQGEVLELYSAELPYIDKDVERGHVSDADFIKINRISKQKGAEQIDFAAAIVNNVSWFKDARSTTRNPTKRAHPELDDFSPRASWWPNAGGKTPRIFTIILSHTHPITKAQSNVIV